MSSKRLADNRLAIERQITKLSSSSLPNQVLTHLGLGVAIALMGWSAHTLQEFTWEVPRQASEPSIDFEPTSQKPLQMSFIRIQATPARAKKSQTISLPAQTESLRQTVLPQKALERDEPTSIDRSSQTRLSALLHQFTHAKKAQDDGYLEEAKELFLTIARSGLHPALGQESYGRALEILRRQKNQLAYETLAKEARIKWPNLKLEEKH